MPNGKPNILVLWGDDIGITNLSCYSDGLMGYRTPNIDRIADEGARFTDYYGEQSCTAGRAAFITDQNPYRTGLTKVGPVGADLGLRDEDPRGFPTPTGIVKLHRRHHADEAPSGLRKLMTRSGPAPSLAGNPPPMQH